MKKVVFILFLFSRHGLAHEKLQSSKWAYGVGFGIVHFEQYPASDQFTTLALPVPTFEYRGEILYADDREGIQAFFFKSEQLKVEFSGFGYTPLNSSESRARSGMKDIPVVLALGPQISMKFSEYCNFSLLLAQGFDLSAERQATSGAALQARLIFNFESHLSAFQDTQFLNRFFITSRWGTKRFLKNFYEVQVQDVSIERPSFKAKEGLLSHELGYLIQSNYKQWSSYLGWALSEYSESANKASPLHRANQAFTFFVGLNFVLGHSKN